MPPKGSDLVFDHRHNADERMLSQAWQGFSVFSWLAGRLGGIKLVAELDVILDEWPHLAAFATHRAARNACAPLRRRGVPRRNGQWNSEHNICSPR